MGVIAAFKSEKEKLMKLLTEERQLKKSAVKKMDESDSLVNESSEAITSLTEELAEIKKRLESQYFSIYELCPVKLVS